MATVIPIVAKDSVNPSASSAARNYANGLNASWSVRTGRVIKEEK